MKPIPKKSQLYYLFTITPKITQNKKKIIQSSKPINKIISSNPPSPKLQSIYPKAKAKTS